MLPFNLSKADADTANIERKMHKSPLVRDRMYVLHLLYKGYKRHEAAAIVGCHANSVANYVKLYQSGGLDAVRQLNYTHSRHELSAVYEQVDEALSQAECTTLDDAREVLRSAFGYSRSKEAVRRLLHYLGLKRRKTGTFPGKIDDFDGWKAKQEMFVEKLEGLIQQAGREEIDLVFGDAAHFVYGKFSSFHWGKKPRCRPSGHGRYRINVYGVYDVVTNQVCTMYNEGYIDTDFMAEYLEWLRSDCYPEKDRPLHLVLDNARYQHCEYVKECARGLNIELDFLPGYSPNLNVIERLWKYLKKKLGKQYHDCKATFEKSIVELLESLGNDIHQEKLWTLLNPVFQRYEKSQILGC